MNSHLHFLIALYIILNKTAEVHTIAHTSILFVFTLWRNLKMYQWLNIGTQQSAFFISSLMNNLRVKVFDSCLQSLSKYLMDVSIFFNFEKRMLLISKSKVNMARINTSSEFHSADKNKLLSWPINSIHCHVSFAAERQCCCNWWLQSGKAVLPLQSHWHSQTIQFLWTSLYLTSYSGQRTWISAWIRAILCFVRIFLLILLSTYCNNY